MTARSPRRRVPTGEDWKWRPPGYDEPEHLPEAAPSAVRFVRLGVGTLSVAESLDLRWAFRVLRRQWRYVVAALLVGVLLGMAYGFRFPPPLRSTALVLLAPSPTTPGGTPTRDVSTEVHIALSRTVLAQGGNNLTPHLSADEVAERIKVTSVTDDILQFRAEGATAEAAEQLANAVAQAYITYSVGSTQQQSGAMLPQLESRAAALTQLIRNLQGEVDRVKTRLSSEAQTSAEGTRDASLLGSLLTEQSDIARLLDQVNGSISSLRNGQPPADSTSGNNTGGSTSVKAQLLQPGSPATRSSVRARVVELAATVGLALTLLASITLVVVERRDRRLWTRDEIAAALAAPVLGSIPARPQRDVEGWTDLLRSYHPSPGEEWSLRKTLRQLGMGDARGERGSSLLMMSFDEDTAGLALAAQLAITAAMSGLRTVLAPVSGLPSAATFRAACSRQTATGSDRLRVESARIGELSHQHGDFVVFVAVVSRSNPVLVGLPRSAATVLSLAAGGVIADELARVAVAADDAGRPLDGVLVADPRPDDTTSGGFQTTGRLEAAVLPTRVTGVPTERRQ